jgi:transcription elongation GreA/GreB family factor
MIYNLFHSNTLRAVTTAQAGLEDKAFEKLVGKDAAQLSKHLKKTLNTIPFNEAVAGIEKLRELHVQMDEAVLEAYGWQDIQLRHNFYEVDYLPENDRIRYTIHPDARKEVLKRLLELNHQIHKEEVKAGLWDKKGSSKKKAAAKAPKATKAKQPVGQSDLFAANTPLFAQTVTNQVQEGSKVTLGHTGGQRMKYAILPNAQKDILTTDGYKQILPTSGLAQVLIGKQPGVKVEFGGSVYEVLEVV